MDKELPHYLNYGEDLDEEFPEDEILGEDSEEESEETEEEEDDEFSEE